MSRWRPSPGEERWLTVAAELGAVVPRSLLAERAGAWRSTGPLARVALFVLGFVAAALLLAILGFDSEATLLVAGLIAALAAEWFTVSKRLHASGIEEGLCLAGYLLVGFYCFMPGLRPSGSAPRAERSLWRRQAPKTEWNPRG